MLFTAAPIAAWAHIPDQFDSVHFNSGNPDFGTLPRRGDLIGEGIAREGEIGMNDWWPDDAEQRQRKCELTPERSETRAVRREHREMTLRAAAARAIARSQWDIGRRLYARAGEECGWTGDLRDRVEILSEATHAGAPLPSATIAALRGYLHALDAPNDSFGQPWDVTGTAFDGLSVDPANGFVRPYASYQRASLDYALCDFSSAATRYSAFLRDYPHAAKREATLIMLARAEILPRSASPSERAAGIAALDTLLREFPHTRFRRAAPGLRARVDYFAGRYPAALNAYFAVDDLPSVEIVLRKLSHAQQDVVMPRLMCAYLRRLNRASAYEPYVFAVEGVRSAITRLTPIGARDFVRQLRHEPTLAAPYFYFRLYHCDNKPRDLRHLAQLARSLAAAPTYAARPLPPVVAVRLAEVFYQNHEDADALAWARTAAVAYAATGSGAYDRAPDAEGATQYRCARCDAAQIAFETLLARCPRSPLRWATHEELALVYEGMGDLAAALDQYFVLDYKPDIAFFLDARMTTAQVAAYVAARPRHPLHALLVYSLGIRYLRDENWTAARNMFRSLPRSAYRRLSALDKDYGYRDDPPDPNPLQTTNALARLFRAAQSAPTADARATALYHYASYYYEHGTLLLYNNALWHDTRELCFDFWGNTRHATAEDIDAARSHMDAHETYARTEAICVRIAHEYPDSPTAPYALYRAGCCASKLANFNGWWRDDNRRRDHYTDAARLMARLARRYPRHALAADARKFAGIFHDDALADAQERHDDDIERAKYGYSYERGAF